ncbi:hypothetical protein [Hufsiella ginkgonis]|uniref:Transporter n=1 Tax=Hufsiella ginkgonis TaxID=2695274 RepID=A0A7K1XWB8_9SPHI|nr:hypothetical protein [Hufsiella ginkgonis]MXV15285.1 hypothetical protein [Hufsiella ginkgonis]
MSLFTITVSPSYKQVAALLLILLGPVLTSEACEICGCFMGITPYDNQSSFAMLYRFRTFSGYDGQAHPIFPEGAKFFPAGKDTGSPVTDHNGDPSDFEAYRTLELRGRYFIHQRLELNAILPYISNSERYNGNLNTLAGAGDINLFAGYHLLRKLGERVNQRLIAGAGVKLPTGKNDAENAEGIRFNALTQTGTGSTDGFVYLNYLASVKKLGLNLNTTYKVNGRNKEQESIANSTTANLNVFYSAGISQRVKLIPSAQLAYEYSAGEKYQGIKTGEHVMNNLLAGAGLDLFVNNLTFNLALQSRVWSAKDDHPQPAGRVVLGITYSFKQLYYALK